MSGLPATFPCPWCAMSYPAKPVLIGKLVRCKGCRNAFVLQEDGTARKHEDAPVPAPPAASPPAPKPAPPPPPPVPPAPKPAPPAPKPAPAEDELSFDEPAAPARPIAAREPTPPPRPVTPAPAALRTPLPEGGAAPKSERLVNKPRKGKTEQLEAARAKMAAELAAVAAKAANAESAKREERKSERLAKAGGTGKPAGDGKARSRKVVLTDEGMRLHRERVLWLVGSLVAVGVVALLMLVFSFRSGIRSALDAYTAPVPDTRFMAFGTAVRARAWLAATPSQPGGPVIAIDLADAEFAAQRTIDLAQAKDAFAQLKGLRPLSGTTWWVPRADEAKARIAIAGAADAPGRALAAARIRAVDLKGWAAKLPFDEDDRRIVLDLIGGTPSKEGMDFAKRMLDEGEVPDRLQVRPFSGRKGDLRLDLGPPPYKQFSGPYRGLMLRVEGVGWPSTWKVLELVALVGEKRN